MHISGVLKQEPNLNDHSNQHVIFSCIQDLFCNEILSFCSGGAYLTTMQLLALN